MTFGHGRDLAEKLREALRINRPVRSITIKGDCREAASVEIEFVPSPDDIAMIASVLKSYQLVQIEPIETRHFDV